MFINGIPFAVIECKAPHIPVDEAVGQMIRNQQAAYIPQLFKFAQLVVATNKNAVKYATVGTPKKFWSVWKEQDADWLQTRLKAFVPDRMPTEQDRNIVSLFSPERVYELIRSFILFDANVKGLPLSAVLRRPGNHEDHRRATSTATAGAASFGIRRAAARA